VWLTTQLPVLFDKFVMSLGILIGILVTSNMIPETFEPGSLNLLLSKPILRWGLFIAKFLGGCVLIALCSAYLFVGVWLWLGIAMDVWDKAILLSIPLYVLVFAIYFSVSALVGLLYRSAIVSVILTLLFWAVCFSVGIVYGIFANNMRNNAMVDIVVAENSARPVDVLQNVANWDESQRDWAVKTDLEAGADEQMALNILMYAGTIADEFPNPIIPVYDTASRRIVSTRFRFSDLQIATWRPLLVTEPGGSDFKQVGRFPADTIRLLPSNKGVIAVTGVGEFFLIDELQVTSNYSSVDEKKPQDSEVFRSIGPDEKVSVRARNYVALNSSNQRIAVYRKGKLTIFSPSGDEYRKHAELTLNLDFSNDMSCLVEYQGGTIVLAFGNGRIITVDGESLTEKNEYVVERRSAIVQVSGSPDGKWFTFRYRNGRLWTLDANRADAMQLADVSGQGSISAAHLTADQRLWVVDRTDRLTQYDLGSGDEVQQFSPRGSFVERAFRYVLDPFYKICPKPSEFYKVVTHLASASDTKVNQDVDLRQTPEQSDPWSPLWSGLAFMGSMLLIACVIFHFKDF
jgi:ABC-type transport system involved in multi-copper enzyme maturation permease subunit